MISYRIAIATSDGVSVCGHLARSTSFLVVQVEDGRVVAETNRSRSNGPCGNHGSFVEMLQGCRAVVCGGVGQGAVDALKTHGVETLVIAGPLSTEEAVSRYLAGTLVNTGERVCLCH